MENKKNNSIKEIKYKMSLTDNVSKEAKAIQSAVNAGFNAFQKELKAKLKAIK